MNKDVAIYNFEGETVRIVNDENGEPWFVAKDVAERLGYVWNGEARVAHIPKEWRRATPVMTLRGDVQGMITISEQGLYFFLARSDKEKAVPFQKWVAGTVLPSIRKTGSYTAPKQLPQNYLEALKELVFTVEKLQVAETKIVEDAPKVEFHDKVLVPGSMIMTSQISKSYGMSAMKLNQLLKGLHIQWSCNGQWLLKAKYQGQGYEDAVTIQRRGMKKPRIVTVWTPKGREFIYNQLKKIGVTPMREE